MNFNFIQKLIISIFFISFILYICTDLISNQLAYSIFDIDAQGNFNLSLNEENAFITIKNVALLNPVKSYSYIIAFLTGFLSLFFLKNQIKERNWLFISIVLMIIIFALDFFPNFQSVRLSMAIYLDGVNFFNDGSVNAFFVEVYKSTIFSVMSGFSFLAKISLVFLFVFKPTTNNQIEDKQ